MAATSLPRLTSPDKLGRRPQYFTPQPVHMQGFHSHRDPIVGTTRPNYMRRSKSTLLPNIYHRNFNKNVRYEPRLLCVVDVKTGKKVPFKGHGNHGNHDNHGNHGNTHLPKVAVNKAEDANPAKPGPVIDDPRLQRSMTNIHERSIFEDTGYASSYYIIHPDWTSELHGRHKLCSKEKSLYGYDSRPAVHPLSAYIEPLLEKRRKRDEYVHSMEQGRQITERQNTARQSAQDRCLKPMTPRDPQGHYKAFTVY